MKPTLLVAALLAPASLAGQIAPDTPRLISPHGSGGLGLHFVRAATLPGDGDALFATWAMPGLPDGVRLRGGFGQGARGVNAVLGGIDVQAPLIRGSDELPFDLDWQGGLGVSFGDYAVVTLPVGLSGGVSWSSGATWVAPYATAGFAADLRMGNDAPEREFEVNPSLDVGLDVSFDLQRSFVLRAAASFGDRQAISLGFALGLGRLPASNR